MAVTHRVSGSSLDRVEGREKVTGEAVYASEYERDGMAYAALVQATIASGEIIALHAESALAVPGVVARGHA